MLYSLFVIGKFPNHPTGRQYHLLGIFYEFWQKLGDGAEVWVSQSVKDQRTFWSARAVILKSEDRCSESEFWAYKNESIRNGERKGRMVQCVKQSV